MNVKTLTLNSPLFPESLKGIPSPPQQLYYLGNLEHALQGPRLAIVGSRKVSSYGKSITLRLAREAAEQGICIVSGLALGIDGLAHQAALDAGGKTIAVLPSGLDEIYPASHQQLAMRILEQGGALLSEYPSGTMAFKTNFVERNRLVSGLSEAVLIPEAAVKSGTLHTAAYAKKQGRPLLVVPGNITSEQSTGANNLIKQGATPITEIRDILAAMHLKKHHTNVQITGTTDEETAILRLIKQGIHDSSELLHHSQLALQLFNQTLTMLEITGKIKSAGNGKWGLA